jgi:histidine triad (HIT) family protein
MPRDANCTFCKIVDGEIPAAKVLETDSVVAFLDIAPVAPGHVLVVPKEHYARLADTPSEVSAALASELPRLTRAVLAATGSTALNVLQNNGREAGQLVDHVHFHLIPRRPGDEFRYHWPRTQYAEGGVEQMRASIAKSIGNR